MKKIFIISLAVFSMSFLFIEQNVDMKISKTFTVDSLGACQGVSFFKGKVYLYGDREVGVIREYQVKKGSLIYNNKEIKLTEKGNDKINHPTGIANNGSKLTFIGNSIRLNDEGTKWKAMIYLVNWAGILSSGKLEGNIENVIEDDACIQGTRPEYVQYKNKWYVATADYGNKDNEVRLYDPQVLKKASRTSEKGVLFKKFSCDPWVQNLHWIPEKNILVLIQNQVEGRKWRFSFVDFIKSIESGKQVIIKKIDLEKDDELEGYSFINDSTTGIAVTSSAKNNVHFVDVQL